MPRILKAIADANIQMEKIDIESTHVTEDELEQISKLKHTRDTYSRSYDVCLISANSNCEA